MESSALHRLSKNSITEPNSQPQTPHFHVYESMFFRNSIVLISEVYFFGSTGTILLERKQTNNQKPQGREADAWRMEGRRGVSWGTMLQKLFMEIRKMVDKQDDGGINT